MSKHIHKSHNVTITMYHIVCPTKYRRIVFDQKVDEILKEICLEISERYEIDFIEIGADNNHVHFLVQSVPMYSPTQITRIIKSITAREIFIRAPEVKKKLWGGQFWSKGFYLSTVGKYGNEGIVARYVKAQGSEKDYKTLYKGMRKLGQMTLWDEN